MTNVQDRRPRPLSDVGLLQSYRLLPHCLDPPPVARRTTLEWREADINVEHDPGPQWGGFASTFGVMIPRRETSEKNGTQGAGPSPERPRTHGAHLSCKLRAHPRSQLVAQAVIWSE